MKPVYGDSGPQGLGRFECGMPPWDRAMQSHAQMMVVSSEGVEDVGGGALLEEAGHWGGGAGLRSLCLLRFLSHFSTP